MSKEVKSRKAIRPDGIQIEQQEPVETPRPFALLFDLDGRYKERVALPENVDMHAAARFPSGDFLEIGMSAVNQTPVMSILDYRGTFVIPVQLTHPLAASSPQTDQISEKANAAFTATNKQSWALDLIQIVHYKDSLLLVQPDSSKPLLLINRYGTVTEIFPKLGVTWPIDSAFVSADSIYLRVRSSSTPESESRIYQINPTDGRALREFRLGKINAYEVTCIEGESVKMISDIDPKKHTMTWGEGRIVPIPQVAPPSK